MKLSTRMAACCIALAAVSLICNFQEAVAKDDPPAPANTEVRRLETSTKPWKGDFDGMLERHVIRFYVPYSRSLYFVDKHTPAPFQARPAAPANMLGIAVLAQVELNFAVSHFLDASLAGGSSSRPGLE